MRTKITKKTVKKLMKIQKMQWLVANMVQEIEREYGIDMIVDEADNWTWGMYIDQNGDITSVDSSINLLNEFIKKRDENV